MMADRIDEVYAAVVHEVKNQLAELALRLGQRPDAKTEMLIAMNAAHSLSELLLLHRQSLQLLEVNSDQVNAADFLAILAAEHRELFPEIRIEIDTSRAPCFAFFDDALVRIALANALHNACRFACSKVKLSVYERDTFLVFEISDDGAGFPLRVLQGKACAPAAVSTAGTGLGLYLAAKIAQLHRLEGRSGYIALCNEKGAVFRMMLP